MTVRLAPEFTGFSTGGRRQEVGEGYLVEGEPDHKVLAERLLANLRELEVVHAEGVRLGVRVRVEHLELERRELHVLERHHELPLHLRVKYGARRLALHLGILGAQVGKACGDDKIGRHAARRLDVLDLDDVHLHSEGLRLRLLDLNLLAGGRHRPKWQASAFGAEWSHGRDAERSPRDASCCQSHHRPKDAAGIPAMDVRKSPK